jgi:hypothetical protein
MEDWVGVLHSASCIGVIPKKELLLFDRVTVVGLNEAIKDNRSGFYPNFDIANDLEFLAENGLLTDHEGPPQDFFINSGRSRDLLLMKDLYDSADQIRKVFCPGAPGLKA